MLKNHPLKQQITQSKEILDLTQKIIDDSYDIKDEAAYKSFCTAIPTIREIVQPKS